MTLQTSKLTKSNVANQIAWATTLDASDTSPKETLGAVREDYSTAFGHRRFQYVRFHVAATAGIPYSYLAPVSVANILSGTTTSITTTGLTADIYKGALLRCTDDAGAAGAAPEGEIALITDNTTAVITIDSNDAFSVAPAVNDDFHILVPFAVIAAASGDTNAKVAGVAMTSHAQYNYGWVQFQGLHPSVVCVAAGTAVTAEKAVIASTACVTVGSSSAVELRVGYTPTGISSDTVARILPVSLFCGAAFPFGAST
jgi:hypothetical protein